MKSWSDLNKYGSKGNERIEDFRISLRIQIEKVVSCYERRVEGRVLGCEFGVGDLTKNA